MKCKICKLKTVKIIEPLNRNQAARTAVCPKCGEYPIRKCHAQ